MQTHLNSSSHLKHRKTLQRNIRIWLSGEHQMHAPHIYRKKRHKHCDSSRLFFLTETTHAISEKFGNYAIMVQAASTHLNGLRDFNNKRQSGIQELKVPWNLPFGITVPTDFKWVGFNKIILHVNRENLQPDTCSIGAQTETWLKKTRLLACKCDLQCLWECPKISIE